MFSGCTNLVTIYVTDPDSNGGNGFTVAKVTNSKNMFTNCKNLKGGDGTEFSASYVNKTYARVDKKNSGGNAGYFSVK